MRNKMINKIMSGLILFSLVSLTATASPRNENVSALIRMLGVEQIVDQAISNYKGEIIRLYPGITKKDLAKKYSDIFLKARNSLIRSYEDAFAVYTDAELAELVDFYNTDFGQWLSAKELKYNRQVQINFEKVYKELNEDFAKRSCSRTEPLIITPETNRAD